MRPSCEVIRKHVAATQLIKQFLSLKNVIVHYRVHKSTGEPVELSMPSIKSKQHCHSQKKRASKLLKIPHVSYGTRGIITVITKPRQTTIS